MNRNGEQLTDRDSPAPPGGAPDVVPATSDRYRLLALAGLTLVLIGLCVLVAVPFLPAVTWSIALAIIAWPMHHWISRHIAGPRLAAVLSTAAVVILIVGPGLFVTYHLALEAGHAAERVQQETSQGGLRKKMAEVPALATALAWLDRVDVDVETEIRRIIAAHTQDATGLVEGSITAVVQFLVVVFILYHVFRDRPAMLRGLRALLPMSRAESDRVFARAADSVYANLYATVITSVIDAVGGGLMFWLLGLPSPFLWGVVIFVLSILPIVGAGLVWGPAAVYLALSGQWLAAAALLAWGILSFLIVDNVIYVRLAGERMRMHQAPALIAFLGGLAVFGLSGMILGPAILAVTVAVLEAWKRRLAAADILAAEAGDAEPARVGQAR